MLKIRNLACGLNTVWNLASFKALSIPLHSMFNLADLIKSVRNMTVIKRQILLGLNKQRGPSPHYIFLWIKSHKSKKATPTTPIWSLDTSNKLIKCFTSPFFFLCCWVVGIVKIESLEKKEKKSASVDLFVVFE